MNFLSTSNIIYYALFCLSFCLSLNLKPVNYFTTKRSSMAKRESGSIRPNSLFAFYSELTFYIIKDRCQMHTLKVFRSPVWLLLHKLSSPHYHYNDLLLCRKSTSNKTRCRQWFDRCITSKMILKSGSNWLFPVVFFSWNNIIRVPFHYQDERTQGEQGIRAIGPGFALCHAWPFRCEIIYWF
jgi:hypothetical protein